MAIIEDHGSVQNRRAVDRTVVGKYIALAALKRAEVVDAEDDLGGGGLSFGITSYQLRRLTDNPWNGGGGYTYEQVAKMTPDQVYHRLCDEAVLKTKGGKRVSKMEPTELNTNPDGTVNGRDEQGNKIALKIRVGNKSLARRLMEEAEAKAKAEKGK